MISVTLIVKNGERRLRQVLEALASFDEVILYDTGSTDRTLEIGATAPNVVIHRGEFRGFGMCHNEAARLAKHPWILSIDADEILSKELAQEILTQLLDPNCVYALPFHNYYRGKLVKWCGWYPEQHIRLYHREKTHFSEALVHEGVEKKQLDEVLLIHPVLHYPYENVSDFLVKMERYSTLFASQYAGRKSSSPLIALSHSLAAFFKAYILKRGFLGGYIGLLISFYNAHTAFYKYLKLYERNKS